MKKRYSLLPILAALFLFSSCDPDVLTLENSGVYGVARDIQNQRPVANAQIYINGPESQSTLTDANGNYRFEDLIAGSYVISASQERYQTTYVDTDLAVGLFKQVDIIMDYASMLSTHRLDFGSNTDELEIVVTNLLDETVEIDTDEDEIWMTTHDHILSLEPGESDIITVKANRIMMQQSNYSVPLVINVEEEWGSKVLESYVVTVTAQK